MENYKSHTLMSVRLPRRNQTSQSLLSYGLLRALLPRLRLFLKLLLFSVVALATYVIQISQTNAYTGLVPFDIDGSYFIRWIVTAAFVTMMVRTSVEHPSDFFFLFYTFIIVLFYGVFHPVRGHVEVEDFLLHMVVLILPVIVLRFGVMLGLRLKLPELLGSKAVVRILFLLCLIGVGYALLHSPSEAGFDLEKSYDRRMQGREIFASGSPFAYLNSMIINGFAPFLAFISGYSRRRWLFVLAIALSTAYFYILGIKGAFFYCFLAFFVGRGIRSDDASLFLRVLFNSIWLLFCAFIVERWFFGYSLIGETFFRRTFIIPAQTIGAYFDFMFGESHAIWSALSGADTPEGITFRVGMLYSSIKDTNQNTNAFVNALASGGIPAYITTILLVTAVFVFLDAAHREGKNRAYLYLGFIYAILLTEQAATVALFSSGIGFLILLTALSRRDKPNHHKVGRVAGNYALRASRTD